MKNKEQHYVPKFFLRRFSMQNDGKTIGVFNKSKRTCVFTAPLRSQACRPYFYGKDDKLESTFAAMEGLAAELLRKISTQSWLPKPDTSDWGTLLVFILSSEVRTPTYTRTAIDMGQNLYDSTFTDQAVLQKNIGELKLTQEQAIELSVSMIRGGFFACYDLKAILLKNETKQPFITSDNPVVKYNQYLEKRKQHGGITGYIQIGLQIFLPIDSCTMILLYDPWVYKVGGKREEIIRLQNVADINALNLLSVVNSGKVLYFSNVITESYLNNLYTEAKRHPEANKTISSTYYSNGATGRLERFGEIKREGLTDTLFHSYTSPVRTHLSLSFISETKQARRLNIDGLNFVQRKSSTPLEEPRSSEPFRFEYEPLP
jgi:hypothetical protein